MKKFNNTFNSSLNWKGKEKKKSAKTAGAVTAGSQGVSQRIKRLAFGFWRGVASPLRVTGFAPSASIPKGSPG